MEVQWMSRVKLNQEIWKHIYKTGVVLDIGCGLEPQRFFIAGDLTILCEPCPWYAAKLHKRYAKSHKFIVRQFTAQNVAAALPDDAVDTVFMLDSLEHLEKAEGMDIIKRLPGIARRQVVIRVPLGYWPREYNNSGPWDHGISHGNAWQVHRSSWYPEDFDSSWRILGCRHYQYIDVSGNMPESPPGEFYAIRDIDVDGLPNASLSPFWQAVVTAYDCGVIAASYLLRLLPAPVAKFIVCLTMRTIWRRIGV